MDLNTIWFVLLGLLLTGYAVLDGFDLGVGILHPLARDDHERRLLLNAIGPIWDGNEVWLVTFGGALFAAFPEVYATAFSAFYLPFMLLLFALIFRAVSIEFRSKLPSSPWRRAWDFGFFGGSLLASFLFGVAIGNAMVGIPLDERGIFVGELVDLLRPYPLLCGLLTVAMFAMHGAIYLYLKIPHGPFLERVREWMWTSWGLFLALYMLLNIATLTLAPRAAPSLEGLWWTAPVVLLSVLAMANVPRALYHDKALQAFLSSVLAIATLVSLFGAALWPNLLTASNDPTHSLTVYNAASSAKTLQIMLVVAMIGMPLVLLYTSVVYWTFRRRVEIGKHSY